MVGTAVYQVALYVINSDQNVEAENFSGTMTELPDKRGARNAASKP